MKVIGITGGIGSGKSTVCSIFKVMGAQVFHADVEAKALYLKQPIIEAIRLVFGNAVFSGQELDRGKLATLIFGNESCRVKLNNIVHPAVRVRFGEFVNMLPENSIVLREAAILFESGSNADCDQTVVVTAPIDVRLKRVMLRDGLYSKQTEARMNAQWPQEKLVKHATHLIDNSGLNALLPQCLALWESWSMDRLKG